MDFIMTYGWALLIIGVIVAFLFVYVRASARAAPASCLFYYGVHCSDIVIAANQALGKDQLTLVLHNALPYPIESAVMYARINGVNSSASACYPDYVLSGGELACTANVVAPEAVGASVGGIVYVGALYCGLAGNFLATGSCSGAANEIYEGSFNAYVQSKSAGIVAVTTAPQ